MFRNKAIFTVRGLLAPRPTPKLEYHFFSAVRGCLFMYSQLPQYLEVVSSIRNPRTRHAMVTRDPPPYATYKIYLNVCYSFKVLPFVIPEPRLNINSTASISQVLSLFISDTKIMHISFILVHTNMSTNMHLALLFM
jgi:hypothetical protein